MNKNENYRKEESPEKVTEIPIKVYRNQDIKSVYMGIPGSSHHHIRSAIETDDEILVFQEATIAALVRAYVTIKTHPSCRHVFLVGRKVEERKRNYAEWQLLEDKFESDKLENLIQKL